VRFFFSSFCLLICASSFSFSALYDVIFGGKPVRQTALHMMQAAHTSDVEFLMPGANLAL
jgi:hypothetical protein